MVREHEGAEPWSGLRNYRDRAMGNEASSRWR